MVYSVWALHLRTALWSVLFCVFVRFAGDTMSSMHESRGLCANLNLLLSLFRPEFQLGEIFVPNKLIIQKTYSFCGKSLTIPSVCGMIGIWGIAVERFLKCNAEIKCLVDILPVKFFKYLLFIRKLSKMLITPYFFQGGLTNKRLLWNSGVCGSKVDLRKLLQSMSMPEFFLLCVRSMLCLYDILQHGKKLNILGERG